MTNHTQKDSSVSLHEDLFLLTGVSGFLGSEVFCRLVRSVGFDKVFCLVRRVPLPDSTFYRRLREHGIESEAHKINFIETDFSTQESLAEALQVAEGKLPRGKTYVLVHMAAIIHAKSADERTEQHRLNIEATSELLDWAASFGSHFVYISSVVAFGGTSRAGHVRDESDFVRFPWISKFFTYYTSKRTSHLMVCERAKVPVTLLCPGIVHGALEMEKSSRKHLQYLREGKLKWAPSGSGNFVGLDRVSQSVVQAAMVIPQDKQQTRLLVDVNMSFVDYFNQYTRLARGSEAQHVRRLPGVVGWLAIGVYIVASKLGFTASILESLAQGTLHLNFRSKYKQQPTEGLEVNLRRSLGQS